MKIYLTIDGYSKYWKKCRIHRNKELNKWIVNGSKEFLFNVGKDEIEFLEEYEFPINKERLKKWWKEYES